MVGLKLGLTNREPQSTLHHRCVGSARILPDNYAARSLGCWPAQPGLGPLWQ